VRRRSFLVGMAVLALCLSTAGFAAAAPFQPPVTAMSKTAFVATTPTPGGVISYTVQWTTNADTTNVTLKDDFLHGVDLAAGSAGVLVPPVGAPILIFPTQTSSSIDRKTYEFVIASGPTVLPAGTYTLLLAAIVDPTTKVYKGKYVTDSATLYVDGDWKANATVNTNLEPPL